MCIRDSWHALIGVDAVRAGKDVYLQKPASLTIAEGRALSNAVQASGRIPVSYTHLDVYKRQTLFCMPFIGTSR